MKRISSYILAIIVAINSSGCATTELLSTESTPVPYEYTATMPVADDSDMQTDDAIKTIVSLLFIGAIVVLGVGMMTCCNFSSN
jgi:hypothetical protein